MSVGVDETLYLLDGVHDEDVDQILPGAVQPVVERSGSFCEFQMQYVDFLQNPLGLVQSLTSALRQSAQTVPLVAYALAAGVYADAVVVIQSTKKN